ncbi:hypothetical protein [Pseudomonas sp. Irchel 3H7]|uniref:hypothetical protein n=1 Tax=Pseudomonas sp. Irchel 3H7 TaxID=2009042 RepID=UPI0011405A94|nr:hypothetical protein [Pseudomonas sp. Irchel 3H7]
MARDDFSASVVRKLRDRVAHRCSKPNCRVPTSAPQDEDGVTNVGKAAHICAASPGGPRYDSGMTSNERKAFSNGIWLCAIHADEIDRDVNTHTVELLKSWKRQAEAATKTELGQQLPKATDATDLLAMTLSGMPKKFLPNAIRQVHTASANVLAAADPRFDVVSKYDPLYGTAFQVNAKENVQIFMTVGGKDAQIAATGYTALFENGRAFELDAKNIEFQGSTLFELIKELLSGNEGKVSFFRPSTAVVIKLSATDPVTNRKINLDDIPGSITSGTQSYCLQGVSMKGMITLTADVSHNGESSKVNFNINTESWNGREVSQLPWFNKIATFIEAIVEKWELDLSVEIDGEPSAGMALNLIPEYLVPLSYALSYIHKARELSSFLQKPIFFDARFRLAEQSNEELATSVAMIDGYYLDLNNIIFPISGRCVVNGPDIGKLIGNQYEFDHYEAIERKQVEIFGQRLQLPPIRRVVKNGAMELFSWEDGQGVVRIHHRPGISVFSHYITDNS